MNRSIYSLAVVVLLIFVMGGGIIHLKSRNIGGQDSAETGSVPFPHEVNDPAVKAHETLAISPKHSTDPSPLPIARPSISLEEAMRWDGQDLPVEQRPDGTEILHLGGRFTHVSAAVLTPSGELIIQCFSGHAALDAAITAGTGSHPGHPHLHEPVNY